MAHSIEELIDHYLVVCICLALFILTWIDVGNIPITAMLGLILCGAGMVQRGALVDLGILIPLIIYNLAGMASSYVVYGNIAEGYGVMQSLFPILYLLMACLKSKEIHWLRQFSVLWAGIVAAAGMGWFVWRAVVLESARRLDGWLGNANAMGIFLVTGWFVLMHCVSEEEGEENYIEDFLIYIEPVLLTALAMTLSLGSFAAMAAGILILIIEKKRRCSYKDTWQYGCQILAKASLGVGTGVLIYLGGVRTAVPWICLPLVLYSLVMIRSWKKFGIFLNAYPLTAAVISAFGLAVASGIILIRQSSAATFTERLEMMGNGLKYLTRNPLLGVGPYQWRLLNLSDGDKYFNTWHIHNVLIHAGVEFGWIAMAMLILIVIRFYRKKAEPWTKAGFTAFFFHNMIDTSFFYLGITALNLIAAGNPHKGGKRADGFVLKLVFAVFALMYIFALYEYIWMS